jgi:SAM-dependent methyltransferase
MIRANRTARRGGRRDGMNETRLLFSARDYPIFQNRMYDSAEAARTCRRGSIRLVEDLRTGLVRNAAFDPALMEYDAAYQNEQANSAMFARHLDRVADLVVTHMGHGPLIEVGCGKGGFLDLLRTRGVGITGFDPTYEGDDPTIRKTYFEPGLGLSADGLVLRHVLEHIEDPVAFLRQLARANGGGGLIYIEVPCFDWIARNRAWFDIFYEHVNYFRAGDFRRMFGRVLALEHSFNGQYLSVVADLSTLREPVRDPGDAPVLPADFAPRLSDAGPCDVVWGGASKGVILSLLRERAGRPVASVIDINPGKQGRYLAGTGLRVEAPGDVLDRLGPDARILVMNPNYMDEIRAMSGDRFTYVAAGT